MRAGEGKHFASSHSVLRNRWRSVPLIVSASCMLLLAWTSRTNTESERQGGARRGGHKEKKKKPFPGICAFTLKIKPSKNPIGKKKAQAGSCIGVLLTRIVNVVGIKKQSRVQYDTSLHAFMSASVRLVLQKLRIELSTWGTIKVVRESSLPELSEQRLAGYLRRAPALFLKTCDLETQLSNQAN